MAYPTSIATDADLYLVKNQLATQLDGSIDAVVTTITVDSTTGFPTVGTVTIDSEVIKYTGTTATQFTGCTRGFDGTGATTHTDNAPVRHAVTAIHHNSLKDELISVETDLVNYTNAKFGMKNRIINGDVRIDQKHAGAAATANNSTLAYVPDMFLGVANFGGALEGTFSLQQLSATPPAGFTHYTRLTVTAADASISAANAYEYLTSIEGTNLRDFDLGKSTAKTFTFSFWVRSSVTGTFGGGFLNEAQDRSYVFQYTINSANTWERKTVSLTGDLTGTWVTGITRGMQIFWDIGSGTNFDGTANAWQAGSKFRAAGNTTLISTNGATLDLTGIQLELGSVATAFEVRPFGQEVALCQRYYEKSYALDTAVGAVAGANMVQAVGNTGTGPSVWAGPIMFKVPKRTNPTMLLYSSAGTLGSWSWAVPGAAVTERATTANTTGGVIAIHGFTIFQSVNGTEFSANGHYVANASLQ